MRTKSNELPPGRVSGFEGYSVYDVHRNFLLNKETYTGISAYGPNYWYTALNMNGKEFKARIKNNLRIPDGGKVWIYPECKISRSEVYSKYTKAPDIPSADAIVIPDWDVYTSNGLYIVAVNEKHKICCLTDFYWYDKDIFDNLVNKIKIGETKIGDISNLELKGAYCQDEQMPNDIKPFKDAIIIACCEGFLFRSKYDYLMDIFEGIIPEEKVIYTSDLQKQISEDATATFEEMSSVYEMLVSKDPDTEALGLRTLASLPYAHYPCSTVFVLKESLVKNSWPYSSATKLTAVNAMLRHLGYYRMNIGYDNKQISEKDWQLLRKLMAKYNGYDFEKLAHMPFLKINTETDTIYPVLCD